MEPLRGTSLIHYWPQMNADAAAESNHLQFAYGAAWATP